TSRVEVVLRNRSEVIELKVSLSHFLVMGIVEEHSERIAIRLGADDAVNADNATALPQVEHVELLAKFLLEIFGQNTCGTVRTTAGTSRHHNGDRPCRPLGRQSRQGCKREEQSQDSGARAQCSYCWNTHDCSPFIVV